MTASRAERAALVGLLALAAALAACRTPGAPPLGPALENEVRFPARVPDVADHTAVELAAAALRSDRGDATLALGRLRAIDTVLEASDEPATGLLAISTDLVNTTLESPRAYREATFALLEDADPGPALASRLEQATGDDPLALARQRIGDHYRIEFARAFNAVAEPIGSSLLFATLAPYRLARSAVNYSLQLYSRDALSLQRRQALAHWREFLARYPDAPEVEELLPRVREAERRWSRLQRDRAVRRARRALERAQPREALVHAGRALRLRPEDRAATELRAEAAQRLLAQHEARARSVDVVAGADAEPVPPAARALTLALLAPEGDVAGAARDLLEDDPHGALADEARYALALARAASNDELAAWEDLAALARRPDPDSNMARHAQALLRSDEQNPYGAFSAARRRGRGERLRAALLGSFWRGPKRRGLPRPLEWLVDLPAMAQSVAATPMRLLGGKQPPLPSERAAAVFARRYLARSPDGARAVEARQWLEGFERRRGNQVALYHIARADPEVAPERLEALREDAARHALEGARREKRRSLRNAMIRRVASAFAGTEAAREAGRLARAELEEATPTHIRVSRGFLLEHPQVAGPRGLGLQPALLDGDAANGELHPDGAALVGGRTVELSLLDRSGDEDDPPERVRQELSPQRFAMLVSLLEETAWRGALLDADASVEPDAQRDLFFERARLGLADAVDLRDQAASTYSYRGLRERYGMVRARESILPFDLVVRGSLSDLGLGAFPRMRMPRETPDAFLYE